VNRRDPRRLGRGPRDRLPRRGGADVRRGARSLGRPAAPRGSTGGKPPLAAENDIEVAVIDYSNLNVIVEQPRCRSRRSGPTRRSVAYFDGGIGQGDAGHLLPGHDLDPFPPGRFTELPFVGIEQFPAVPGRERNTPVLQFLHNGVVLPVRGRALSALELLKEVP